MEYGVREGLANLYDIHLEIFRYRYIARTSDPEILNRSINNVVAAGSRTSSPNGRGSSRGSSRESSRGSSRERSPGGSIIHNLKHKSGWDGRRASSRNGGLTRSRKSDLHHSGGSSDNNDGTSVAAAPHSPYKRPVVTTPLEACSNLAVDDSRIQYRRHQMIVELEKLYVSIDVVKNRDLADAIGSFQSGLYWLSADVREAHRNFRAAEREAIKAFQHCVQLSTQIMATKLRVLVAFHLCWLLDVTKDIVFSDLSSQMIRMMRTALCELCDTTHMKSVVQEELQKKVMFKRMTARAKSLLQQREYIQDVVNLRSFLEKLFFYPFPVLQPISDTGRLEEMLPRKHQVKFCVS